jgi:hypothetical protein
MRFEVLTVVKTSVLVFWVVTLCGLAYRYQHLGGTYCLCIFSPEDGDIMFLRNTGICLQVHMVLQPRRPTLTIVVMFGMKITI